ncbi:MAG: glycosyltransferase family 2 protein [Patescibacteria group bacterium]
MKSPAPLISTIIVSYNTADLTCQAVQSVLDEYIHSNIDGELIVIDNHSTDTSIHQLKKLFHEHITLIANSDNLGFAQANNIGIRRSKGTYIFLLNSDTTVHPHAIRELLNVFTRYPDKNTAEQAQNNSLDKVGIISCKLLNLDGTLQKQGGALPNLWTIILWWLLPLPASLAIFPSRWSYHIEHDAFFDTEQAIGWLGGTAMMIRREVINQIGLLDEGIFMYSEDVEYCLRARHHHWDIVYTPSTEITHFGSASSSPARATLGELIGLNHLAQKHFPAWKAKLTRKILRLGCLLRIVLFGIILRHAEKKKIYQEAFNRLSTTSKN